MSNVECEASRSENRSRAIALELPSSRRFQVGSDSRLVGTDGGRASFPLS